MLVPVMTKARKWHGQEFPAAETDYAISFNDDDSITIYRKRIAGATFRVGDEAEYDSYNLRYTGIITKITKKAITIVAYKGRPNMEETYRLDLNKFSWRNYDFNAAAVAAYNATEMQCI